MWFGVVLFFIATDLHLCQCLTEDRYVVKVLTQHRFEDLSRLLQSLQGAEYDTDRVDLEVWLDQAKGYEQEQGRQKIIDFLREEFQWTFGSFQVFQQEHWVGLRGQWLSCYSNPQPGDVVVILEDDLEVSRMFFKWLIEAHKQYRVESNLAGFSLLRNLLVATDGSTIQTPIRLTNRHSSHDVVYLYRLVGSWGFSPIWHVWRDFLEAVDRLPSPEVPGLVTSSYYRDHQRRNTTHSLWTSYFIYFCHFHDLYTLYPNFDHNLELVKHWKSKGEHFAGNNTLHEGTSISLLDDETLDFSFPPFNQVLKLDWNGQPLYGKIHHSNRRSDVGVYYGEGDEIAEDEPKGAGTTIVYSGDSSLVRNISRECQSKYWTPEDVCSTHASSVSILLFVMAASLITLVFANTIGQKLLKSSTLDNLQKSEPVLQLMFWIGLAFFGETVFPTTQIANKHATRIDTWLALCVLVLTISLSYRRTLPEKEQTFLNRAQTNEWKGWMQLAFVFYHYTGATPAFGPIRVMVTCYVWMTGFGNSVYFWHQRDFSMKRVLKSIWRMNFLAVPLSVITKTPWISYYVVALHTTHFLLTYICFLTAKYVFISKYGKSEHVTNAEKLLGLGLMAVCIFVLWDIPVVYDVVVNYPLQTMFGGYFASYFEYRTYTDHWSCWLGALFAFVFPYLRRMFHTSTSVFDLRYGVPALLASLFLVFMWMQIWLIKYPPSWSHADNFVYAGIHPFIGTFPIPAYILLRNSTPSARAVVSRPLEWMGEWSLELYLIQFHLFLSRRASEKLSVFPDFDLINMLFCFVLYCVAARFLFNITATLRDIVFKSNIYVVTAAVFAVVQLAVYTEFACNQLSFNVLLVLLCTTLLLYIRKSVSSTSQLLLMLIPLTFVGTAFAVTWSFVPVGEQCIVHNNTIIQSPVPSSPLPETSAPTICPAGPSPTPTQLKDKELNEMVFKTLNKARPAQKYDPKLPLFNHLPLSPVAKPLLCPTVRSSSCCTAETKPTGHWRLLPGRTDCKEPDNVEWQWDDCCSCFQWTKTNLETCLANRHILFAGDSTARVPFYHLVKYLKDTENISVELPGFWLQHFADKSKPLEYEPFIKSWKVNRVYPFPAETAAAIKKAVNLTLNPCRKAFDDPQRPWSTGPWNDHRNRHFHLGYCCPSHIGHTMSAEYNSASGTKLEFRFFGQTFGLDDIDFWPLYLKHNRPDAIVLTKGVHDAKFEKHTNQGPAYSKIMGIYDDLLALFGLISRHYNGPIFWKDPPFLPKALKNQHRVVTLLLESFPNIIRIDTPSLVKDCASKQEDKLHLPKKVPDVIVQTVLRRLCNHCCE